MNNKVHYIKPTNNDFPEAIKDGIFKGLKIAVNKNIKNIKIVITSKHLINSPPNFISQALDKLFSNKGEAYTKKLNKDRCFPLIDFPEKGQTTGINLILLNTLKTFTESDTVVVLVWADYDSFRKMESFLFFSEVDLVAVLFNESSEMDELLSATKAKKVLKTPDPNVTPYTNTLTPAENEVVERLKGININDIAAHTPTKERMDSVITELIEKRLKISYSDFLGYLVNEVNFPLEESIALMERKLEYFGR